ncbi:hypothetical protein CPB85DRAFT_1433775 [Mucidula mucida]|nr:hypothetical protein CPB85DRAFT_1433775 [Mucidula mucida]
MPKTPLWDCVRSIVSTTPLSLGKWILSKPFSHMLTFILRRFLDSTPTLDVPSPRTSCFAGIYLGSANAALAFKVANDHHKVLVSLTRPFVHDFYGCLKDRLDSVATSAPGLHRRLNPARFACLSASTRTPASWPSVTPTWKVALSVFCFDYHGSCRVYWAIGCCPGPVSCMTIPQTTSSRLYTPQYLGWVHQTSHESWSNNRRYRLLGLSNVLEDVIPRMLFTSCT